MTININKISNKNNNKISKNKKKIEENKEKLEENKEKLEENKENKEKLEENKKNKKNKKKLEENKETLEENKEKKKGLIKNSISILFKKKENYSHIHTHVPSKSVPSYKILLKLISKIQDNPELKGFKLLKRYNKLIFYQNIKNEKYILVGIEDTDSRSLDDIVTASQNIFFKTDLKKLKRYKNDLQNIIEFQKDYPTNEYYYMATGASIAGAVIDLFLEGGYIKEATTFNAVIEKRFMDRSDIKNYRIYLNEDVLYLAMGQYACNTKVYITEKNTFINPIKEFNYLFHIHTLNDKRSSSLAQLKKILTKEEEK